MAAVAVVHEAMVARGHDRVAETERSHRPRGRRRHSVMPRSGSAGRLADATIFSTLEPCPMCVGALLETDVAALVYAVPKSAGRRGGHGASSSRSMRRSGAG